MLGGVAVALSDDAVAADVHAVGACALVECVCLSHVSARLLGETCEHERVGRTFSRTSTWPSSERMTSTPIWLGRVLAMAPRMAIEAAMMEMVFMADGLPGWYRQVMQVLR